jgi:hypothetical protein
MTSTDIIRMARECGLHLGGPPIESGLAHFATLAYAAGEQAERERTKRLVEDMQNELYQRRMAGRNT